MEDEKIIELYQIKNENAIKETSVKYGKYIRKIASNILNNESDSEECENDTYQATWRNIPPESPKSLKAFLGRITRNIALDRYDHNTAKKRNTHFDVVLSELEECIPAKGSVENAYENLVLEETISEYLKGIERTKRIIFVRRYWHSDSVHDIALKFGFGESKVKSILMRTRQGLKKYLERQGVL